MDYSLPGSSAHGTLQAMDTRVIAISFFRGSSWPKGQTYTSCIGKRVLYYWDTGEAPILL